MEAVIDKVYLSPPHMNGAEMGYVNQAFSSNWIAPLGENVDKLEDAVKAYINMPYAVALSSGTAAIHLALQYLGVGAGDFVICSDITFIASCNPIKYLQAVPIFIDSDLDSWCMSPKLLYDALDLCKKRGKLPKAVIVVDLYGLSADYDSILDICASFNVPVVEDAAEALGSAYKGQMCGSFGEFGIISFNANKIITTSGGGMVLAKEKLAAEKMKYWATQAREATRHYEHKEIGYNYRLSNISAGIGRGQMDGINTFVKARQAIYNRYVQGLSQLPVKFYPEQKDASPNCWLTVMVLNETCTITANKIIDVLDAHNIEARPFWKPMHQQPVYADCEFFYSENTVPVGEQLFQRAICLPSGSAMSESVQAKVIDVIQGCF